MNDRTPPGAHGLTSRLRFGPYELDLRGGELRRDGRRIRLQEQPFQILRMLVESRGDVVSREQIQKRLWPDDTVVEFEHSINAAVKRLRDALRESADNPRYIKTVARRGYCFIAELEQVAPPMTAAEPPLIEPAIEQHQVSQPLSSGAPMLGTRVRLLSGIVLATLLVAAGLTAWYTRRGIERRDMPLSPLMRFDLDLGNNLSTSDRGTDAILSPDGTRLIYISGSKLFTRKLDQPISAELPGTENTKAPFFSPDGQWVAFFSGGMLKKAPVHGGLIKVLCDGGLAGGGTWADNGNIIAALDVFLSQVPAAGGIPRRLTELSSGEIAHRWPQVLPGGKAILFTVYTSMTGSEQANIEAFSLSNRLRKTVVRGSGWGRYLPSGHLIYINHGTLFAVPFDLQRLEVRGTASPVLDGVAYSAAWGSAQADFSRTGTLVYRSGRGGRGLVTVQSVDRSGNSSPLLSVPGNYLSPTLSPDGSRLALILSGDIWVFDLQSRAMMRLTFGGGYGNPVWTGDGRYLVFRASKGIFWTRTDGKGQPSELLHSDNLQVPWSFAADGKRLAFVEPGSTTGADIWTVPVETGEFGLRAGKPQVFLQTRFDERCPMISPDGHWLAYMSNESGDYQLYVQSFPDKREKRHISVEPSAYPAWSRSGHALFYWQSRARKLMVVPYKIHGTSLIADQPRIWSEKGLISFSTTRSYDPAPDGSMIALMPADAPEEPRNRVVFLLNFFDELRRRVPLTAN